MISTREIAAVTVELKRPNPAHSRDISPLCVFWEEKPRSHSQDMELSPAIITFAYNGSQHLKEYTIPGTFLMQPSCSSFIQMLFAG